MSAIGGKANITRTYTRRNGGPTVILRGNALREWSAKSERMEFRKGQPAWVPDARWLAKGNALAFALRAVHCRPNRCDEGSTRLSASSSI
jgi:hypothetical protein